MASKKLVEMTKLTEVERESRIPADSMLNDFKPTNKGEEVQTVANKPQTEARTVETTKAKQSRSSKVKVIATGNGGNGKKQSKPLTSYDEAAKLFEVELAKLDKAAVMPVAKLVQEHFMASGHKRIGRALLAYARKNGKNGGKSSKK